MCIIIIIIKIIYTFINAIESIYISLNESRYLTDQYFITYFNNYFNNQNIIQELLSRYCLVYT